jgi:hypothetical protein
MGSEVCRVEEKMRWKEVLYDKAIRVPTFLGVVHLRIRAVGERQDRTGQGKECVVMSW